MRMRNENLILKEREKRKKEEKGKVFNILF